VSVSAATESVDVMNRRSGGVVVLVGALSIVAGILAILYPDITLLALALIAGINLLLLGILGLVEAVTSNDDAGGTRVLSGVLGLLGVIAGLVVMRRPGESLLAIILILGVWFVVSGLVDAIRALVVPGDRAFRLLVALFDLVLGGLILALPDESLKTMAVLAGIAYIVRGIFAVVIGLKLRGSAAQSPRPGEAASPLQPRP
jgi:uncharacterized membrane protein HdeD (DUF308 family)